MDDVVDAAVACPGEPVSVVLPGGRVQGCCTRNLDAGSGRGGISHSTVEPQANFQRRVLVALISLIVAEAAMASERLPRTNVVHRDRLKATDR